MRKIEVCCTSLAEAHEAQAGGAVRIELCSALAAGGITPSAGTIAAVARDKSLAIDVNVLIRAREGSFLYTGEEVDIMVRDIELCRREGVHGVVIGALTAEGDIDIEACRRMVEAARGLSVTFHRAFDVCRDPHRALEQIIGLGCDRLLTSGQQPSAAEGAPLIAKLVEQAAARIIIMPGAGIRPDKPCSALTADDYERIAAAIPERINFFIEKNAISFEEYALSKGKDYRNTPYLQVYGKGGERCPVCGNILQRIILGGRSSVFCPHCQI